MSFKLSFSDLLFIVLINGGKFSTENVLDAPYFLNWGGKRFLFGPLGILKIGWNMVTILNAIQILPIFYAALTYLLIVLFSWKSY